MEKSRNVLISWSRHVYCILCYISLNAMAGLLKLLEPQATSETIFIKQYICDVLESSMKCLTEPNVVSTSSTTGMCPRIWLDGSCWPAASFNTTVNVTCPLSTNASSIVNVQQNVASHHCNGTLENWNSYPNVNCFQSAALANFNQSDYEYEYYDINQSDLISHHYPTHPDLDNLKPNDPELQSEFRYNILRMTVTIGHALSLASLLVALCLLTYLRRLRCTRIYIHMNLMASFVLRGLLWILHMAAFQDPDMADEIAGRKVQDIALKVFLRYEVSDLPKLERWKTDLCVSQDLTNHYVWCRVYYVMQNYTVTANYYWLLVEGLYLSFLLKTVVLQQKKFMRIFLIFGWVCPWISVIGSVLAKVLDSKENNNCWWEDKNSTYWWIIKAPILLSLLINFVVFIMVISLVISKLRNRNHVRTNQRRQDFKWRLTKSTLALIPLLGIQYLMTAFLDFRNKEISPSTFVLHVFEVSLTSIQGMLVAFLYCFLNGEVQDECKKTWRRWKLRWELRRRNNVVIRHRRRQRSSTATSITNLYNYWWTPRKSSAFSTSSIKYGGASPSPSQLARNGRFKMEHYSSVLPGITEQSVASDIQDSQTHLTSCHFTNGVHSSGASSIRNSKAEQVEQSPLLTRGNDEIPMQAFKITSERTRSSDATDGMNSVEQKPEEFELNVQEVSNIRPVSAASEISDRECISEENDSLSKLERNSSELDRKFCPSIQSIDTGKC